MSASITTLTADDTSITADSTEVNMSTATPEQCDRKGSELTLYYNTGTCDIPVWVQHLGIVGDLTISETDDEDELSIRDPSRNIKQYIEGRTDIAITGEQVTDPEYEGHSFLTAMRPGGDPGDILVLTGPLDVVGNVGYRGMFRNFDRTSNGPETGAATTAFNLKPAACTTCPVRPVKVSVADTAADYDPGVFIPAVGIEANQDRTKEILVRALQSTGAELVYVNITQVGTMMAFDKAVDMANFVVRQREKRFPTKRRSARPASATIIESGIGEFYRLDLLRELGVEPEKKTNAEPRFSLFHVPDESKEPKRSVAKSSGDKRDSSGSGQKAADPNPRPDKG